MKNRPLRRIRREDQPYIALALVFVVVGVATIDRVANRGGVEPPATPSLTSPLQKPGPELQLPNPLTADPWSFFHPNWSVEPAKSFLSPKREGANAAADPNVDLLRLVSDPSDRLEKDFKVPSYLRDRVLFWMQVHAFYNSRMRIVHDRANPAIVYGYIDFRPIYRVLGAGVAAEVRSNQLEKKILKQLKAKLAEAGGASQSRVLSAYERDSLREFLSRVGALSAEETASRIENIRTQTGQSDEFLSALHRSKHLLPHIESVFRRQGLPVALARIPFVESSFNVRAQSKVGAVGIWQFMPETARQMIHPTDEKAWADPFKQTAGAAKILKIFRSLVPDWGMAVTSYNSGVGRIQRLAKKHHLHTVEGLVNLQADEGLGFAGKNFYAQFLSANVIEAYKEELFNRLLEPADYMLVIKDGLPPFPKESCDL